MFVNAKRHKHTPTELINNAWCLVHVYIRSSILRWKNIEKLLRAKQKQFISVLTLCFVVPAALVDFDLQWPHGRFRCSGQSKVAHFCPVETSGGRRWGSFNHSWVSLVGVVQRCRAVVLAMECQWRVLCSRHAAVCHDAKSKKRFLRQRKFLVLGRYSHGGAMHNWRFDTRRRNETQMSLRATKPTEAQPLRLRRAHLPDPPLRRCQRQNQASVQSSFMLDATILQRGKVSLVERTMSNDSGSKRNELGHATECCKWNVPRGGDVK